MNSMLRFVGALVLAGVVIVIGVQVLNALEIAVEGLVWVALLLVAMIVGSLVDRERFYGPPEPPRPQA